MENIKINVGTEYPVNGKLEIQCNTNRKYLAVRIPEWCEKFDTSYTYTTQNGYMVFDLSSNNKFSIEFYMPVTAIQCNRNVHDNAGRIAITRGPIVYCAEAIDNCQNLQAVYLSLDEEYKLDKCEFCVPNITTTAYQPISKNSLYYRADSLTEKIIFKLIPYYAFANRSESSMLVWFLKK